MLNVSKRRSGFIMAETVVALALLFGMIVFWGSLEIGMQRHEQTMMQKVKMERQKYEQHHDGH